MVKTKKMAKKPVKSKNKRKKNMKSKSTKSLDKTVDAVVPVSTPLGSVHFNEFLKICREPRVLTPVIPEVTIKKAKSLKGKKQKKEKKGKKSNGKGKKGIRKTGNEKKLAIKSEVVQPDEVLVVEPTQPPLFRLNKILLLPSGDELEEYYPDFVVGKNGELFTLKRQSSMRKINIIEKQANNIVDEINKIQEKIKILTDKPKLSNVEVIELEDQQRLLMRLLTDFENHLERIREIFYEEKVENVFDEDDDQWVDVEEENDQKQQECIPGVLDENISCELPSQSLDRHVKWYEEMDLTYLLSPSASSNKDINKTISTSIVKIFDELKGKNMGIVENEERNKTFKRLREKFSVLLPSPNLHTGKGDAIWMDKKLHKDHRKMIKSTNDLKLFRCWKQFELKYYMINALVVSLTDAIKSTVPLYCADKEVKAQFVSDQSVLLQALDEFKRIVYSTFLTAGLDEYWRIYPECLRLDTRPCFDVIIQRVTPEINDALPPNNLSFLHHGPFTSKYQQCDPDIKQVTSKDSEIVVDTHNY